MRAERYCFLGFVVFAVIYIISAILDLPKYFFISNLLYVPFLLLFYFRKAEEIRWFLVLAVFAFYMRDVFIEIGVFKYPFLAFGAFYTAIGILTFYALTEFQKTNVRLAELFSFGIVYAFCLFLFYNLAEMVPDLVPAYDILYYVYLFFIILFLSISFTVYFLKAHKASLWIMLCASSLTFSEASFFFKSLIFKDISVVLFHALFHVIVFLSIVMYALNRRNKKEHILV